MTLPLYNYVGGQYLLLNIGNCYLFIFIMCRNNKHDKRASVSCYITGVRSGNSYYLAPGGGCEVLFSPGLSVCLSVCVCVCVCLSVCLSVYLCVRPIFWYFISRLLEEISI